MNSKALTKIRSIILITVIVLAVLGGVAAYISLNGENVSSETIKIGILTDIDGGSGRHVWQSAVLAAEQINAEGGILGRQVEVKGADTDQETSIDQTKISSALTRLLTVENVDYVIGSGTPEIGFLAQDIVGEQKKIYISIGGIPDELTQRVVDDYNKYKYYFNCGENTTFSLSYGINQLLHAREITGFNKVGYLADDSGWTVAGRKIFDYMLPEVYGFNLVYKGTFPPFSTVDFSSYFAAAEEAGVEILVPLSIFDSGIPLVKEYYDRQSPMLIYGGINSKASFLESWEQTGSKCVYNTYAMAGVTVGYPITSKTLPFHDSYIERWGGAPFLLGAQAYDIIRFILFDALERAGTTEVEAVIMALEETEVETTNARKFAFTSSHDMLKLEGMDDNPDQYGHISSLFQWQEDGSLIPIYPKWLMEEANVTITFPDWSGPWD